MIIKLVFENTKINGCVIVLDILVLKDQYNPETIFELIIRKLINFTQNRNNSYPSIKSMHKPMNL